MPPRLFRALRLTPWLGDAMLRRVDAAFPITDLLTRRIRSGPLRGMVIDLDPRALDMVISRYEPTIQAIFEETLHDGDVVFDVGANVGYFSLLLARCVAPTGCVVAFEPNPRVMSALRQNIARNEASIARVIPVATAAGAAGGSARFAVERRSTRGKVVPEGGDFEVEVTTVDDAAERYGSPRLLKVDVEGAELDVLVGARRVLEETHPTVIVEVHSADLERRSALLLEERGYECERRTDRGKKEPYLLAR